MLPEHIIYIQKEEMKEVAIKEFHKLWDTWIQPEEFILLLSVCNKPISTGFLQSRYKLEDRDLDELRICQNPQKDSKK